MKFSICIWASYLTLDVFAALRFIYKLHTVHRQMMCLCHERFMHVNNKTEHAVFFSSFASFPKRNIAIDTFVAGIETAVDSIEISPSFSQLFELQKQQLRKIVDWTLKNQSGFEVLRCVTQSVYIEIKEKLMNYIKVKLVPNLN